MRALNSMLIFWSLGFFTVDLANAQLPKHFSTATLRLSECRSILEDPKLSFKALAQRISVAKFGSEGRIYKLKESDVEKFVETTWPFIQKLAAESETSVSEMIDEYMAVKDLVTKDSEELSEKQKQTRLKDGEDFRRNFQFLDKLPANAKLKFKHWRHFGGAYSALLQLADLALILETTWRKSATLDPLDFMSEDQFLRTLYSLEMSSLDAVIKLGQRRRDRKAAKANANDLPAELSLLINNPKSDPFASLTGDWLRSRATPPADLPESVFEETEIAQIVLKNSEIKKDTVYSARTIWGRELEVSFSKAVIKDYESGDRENIRTLLRAVINGRGNKAGIKLLGDIGPKIIEVKAFLAGHLRLIGCLDGNRLALKLLDSMPDTRAGYFKKIPANFCD